MARTGEIVAFDVETTGLAPHRGHRVIEIGAVRISLIYDKRLSEWLVQKRETCAQVDWEKDSTASVSIKCGRFS
jgi:DNA polymerase III epsilon subunit-like protein